MGKKSRAKALKRADVLAKSWDDLQRRHLNWPKFGDKYSPTGRLVATPKPEVQSIAPKSKSKFTPHGGTAKPIPVYTGDKMLGVAVMHKSCLQPVFSQEQAEDSAKMRRG